MNNQANFFYALLAVLAVIYIALVIKAFWEAKLYKKGMLGKTQVAGVLSRFAKIRNYKVLNNVKLDIDGDVVHADHILIGFFGILVLDTIQNFGDYFGDDRDDKWVYLDNNDNKKRYIPNPVKANNLAVEKLRKLMGKANIYNLKIDNFVIFTGKEKKTGLYAKESIGAVRLKELKRIIRRSRYTEDNDVDVEKVFEVINNASIK